MKYIPPPENLPVVDEPPETLPVVPPASTPSPAEEDVHFRDQEPNDTVWAPKRRTAGATDVPEAAHLQPKLDDMLQPERGDAILDASGLATALLVSKESVYRLVRARRIRHYRVNGALRFRRSDVNAFLDERRVDPNETQHERKED